LSERVEVAYGEERWEILHSLRGEAAVLMRPLAAVHIECLAYGSLARGDVKPTSDVDIFIPSPPAPELIEAALERAAAAAGVPAAGAAPAAGAGTGGGAAPAPKA
jgi:predicted nucleotidyltransferase